MVSQLTTATDCDCPSFIARYNAPVLMARSRLVMKVPVAGGDVRIGRTRRVAAAAEAESASVGSVDDDLVGSLSGFIRAGEAIGARCQRQGGPAREMA
jgi:hypothetical protein